MRVCVSALWLTEAVDSRRTEPPALELSIASRSKDRDAPRSSGERTSELNSVRSGLCGQSVVSAEGKREREREKERDGNRRSDGGEKREEAAPLRSQNAHTLSDVENRERQCACVCVCVSLWRETEVK